MLTLMSRSQNRKAAERRRTTIAKDARMEQPFRCGSANLFSGRDAGVSSLADGGLDETFRLAIGAGSVDASANVAKDKSRQA
jgi:hypothetical protein